jgi:hypothetical protein
MRICSYERVFEKLAQNVAQHLAKEYITLGTMEESSPKCLATSVILTKVLKVNKQPENSPNPVTLRIHANNFQICNICTFHFFPHPIFWTMAIEQDTILRPRGTTPAWKNLQHNE